MGWIGSILGKLKPSASEPTDDWLKPGTSEQADEHDLWTAAFESLNAGRPEDAVKLGQQARRAEAKRLGYAWNPTFADPEYMVREATIMLGSDILKHQLEGLSSQEDLTLRRLFAEAIFKGIGVRDAAQNVRGLFWSGHFIWKDFDNWCSTFRRQGRWPYMWDESLQERPEKTERVGQFSDRILMLSPEARTVLGVRSRPWQELQSEDAGRVRFHWPETQWAAAQEEIQQELYSWREPTIEDILATSVADLKSYCHALKLPLSGTKVVLQNRLRSIDIRQFKEVLPEIWAPAKRMPWGKGDTDVDAWVEYHNQLSTLFAHRILVSNPEQKRRQLDSYRAESVVKGVKILAVDDPICEKHKDKVYFFRRLPTMDKLPPHYPGCRCTLAPVTISWRELGIDIPDEPN